MLTVDQFCDKHKACKEGRDWALANCSSMIDAWDKLPPEWLVWVATRPGVLSKKELRMFAVYCARSVEHLLTDRPIKDAIDVAERFVYGVATYGELLNVVNVACDLACSTTANEETKAAAYAVVAACEISLPGANCTDLDEAVWAARASIAAVEAICAFQVFQESKWNARCKALREQAKWLRANTRPSFE
jgi:hypothetical protein